MTKPKILALTTSYPLRRGGCAGLFVQNLYRGLVGDFSVDVVCPADCDSVPDANDCDSADGIRVFAVRYAPRPWRVLAQQSGGIASGVTHAPWRVLLLPALFGALFWRSLARAREADLIHANWAVCGAVAGIVGWLCRRPVVTTLRGDDVTRAEKSRVDRAILSLAVRNSRLIACVSAAMTTQLRVRFPRRTADIHVCLNGVDGAFFNVSPTHPEFGSLRVLAVGSLIRRKGFDVLVEAVARAKTKANLRVCVVGEGPERHALCSLASRLGVSHQFDFVGEVSADGVPKVFSEADVFVLPSRSEGRPNVVVEALASGLPVISTNLDGVQGMLDDGVNGWLIAVDDIDGLARALDEAGADPAERQRRARNARSMARAGIGSWTDTAQAYKGLFDVALGRSGKSLSSCAE